MKVNNYWLEAIPKIAVGLQRHDLTLNVVVKGFRSYLAKNAGCPRCSTIPQQNPPFPLAKKLLIGPLLGVILFSSVGCSDSSKADPLLEEAFRLHQQSLETADQSRELLQAFPENDPYRQKMAARLREWEERVIEVPGFEHDHDHDHDHDHHHHHGAQIELTPEDMLIVQQELLDSVQAIQTALLKRAPDKN